MVVWYKSRSNFFLFKFDYNYFMEVLFQDSVSHEDPTIFLVPAWHVEFPHCAIKANVTFNSCRRELHVEERVKVVKAFGYTTHT
jgi:hypothetical protein